MEAYLRRRALRQRVRIAAELRLGAVWKGRRNGRMRRQGRTGSQYVTVVVLSIGTGSGTWVLEERMEQVREIDGEQAYEKMRRAVEKASQPLQPSQYRSRDRPAGTRRTGAGLWPTG